MLIAGTHACRGAVSMSGLASCCGTQSPSLGSTVMTPADTDMLASAPGPDLQTENAKLRKQLQQAQESSQKWQHLHAELHSACVSKLLKDTS